MVARRWPRGAFAFETHALTRVVVDALGAAHATAAEGGACSVCDRAPAFRLGVPRRAAAAAGEEAADDDDERATLLARLSRDADGAGGARDSLRIELTLNPRAPLSLVNSASFLVDDALALSPGNAASDLVDDAAETAHLTTTTPPVVAYALARLAAVSYTHLTLPTILRV